MMFFIIQGTPYSNSSTFFSQLELKPVLIFQSQAIVLHLSYIPLPLNIEKNIIPNEYISTDMSQGFPAEMRISMQAGVPMLVERICEDPSGFQERMEQPKSHIFAMLFLPMRILSGLRSLWTIFLWCACASPSTIFLHNFTFYQSEMVFFLRKSVRQPPGQYSMTMKQFFSSTMQQSINLAMLLWVRILMLSTYLMICRICWAALALNCLMASSCPCWVVTLRTAPQVPQPSHSPFQRLQRWLNWALVSLVQFFLKESRSRSSKNIVLDSDIRVIIKERETIWEMDGHGTKQRVIFKRGEGDISDGRFDVGMGKYNSFLQSYNRLIVKATCEKPQQKVGGSESMKFI